MSSVPENDYIDARLAATDAIRAADAKVYQAKNDARFDKVDTRFDKVDTRFDKVDTRFDKVDTRFDKVDARFERTDARIDSLENTVRIGFESIREQMVIDRQRNEEKFAEFEIRTDAKLYKFQSEITKWVVATVLAGVTVSVSVNFYLFSSIKTLAAPSGSAAPIVLYIQPSMEAAIARLPVTASPTQDKKK